jgi:hypothetical protein
VKVLANLHQSLSRLECFAGVKEHLLPKLSQADWLIAPIYQIPLKLFFKLLNLCRKGRLRDSARLSRPSKMLKLGQRFKVL